MEKPMIHLDDLQVVLPAKTTAVERSAADELVTYVKKMTGKTVATVTEGEQSGKAIYIGATQYASSIPVTYPDNEFGEGWAMKAVDGNLVLTGSVVRGTLYAVYHLLEDELDIHWWNLWEEHVPVAEHAAISADLNRSGVPAMKYRDIYLSERQETLFYKFFPRNRLNGFATNNPPAYGEKEAYSLPYHVHTFNHYFRPVYSEKSRGNSEEWIAWWNAIGNPEKVSYYDEHPDWFAYNKETDERMLGGQLCLNNEELYEAFEKKFLATIQYCNDKADAAGKKRPRYYDITPADIGGHCQCEKCAAAIAKHGPSGNLHRFVNRLADAAKKKFPEENLIIETLAYWDYLEPPLDDTKPADNVVIRYADNFMDILHDIHHKNNADFLAHLKSWQKRVKDGNLQLWDYSTIYATNGVFPCMYKYKENLSTFRAHGVGGYFVELEDYINTDFWDMKLWLLARVMEDPDVDYDALMNTFINGYYGKDAGKYIREYLDFMHEKAEAHDGHYNFGAIIVGAPWLKVEDILKGDALFQKAVDAAADNELYSKRVRAARCGLDRVIVEGFTKWWGQAEDAGISWDVDKKTVLNRLLIALEEQKAKGGDDSQVEHHLVSYREMLNVIDKPPVPLPEEIACYGKENVYEIATVDMKVYTGALTWDNDSKYGLSAVFDLQKCSEADTDRLNEKVIKRLYAIDEENPLPVGVWRGGDPKNVNEFVHLAAKDLIVDGQYHLYKTADTVVIDSDKSVYAYVFRTMELQIHSLPQMLAHLKDRKVDFYISMKVAGDVSCNDPGNYPTFSIDRMFIVDKNSR